ncbi:hypothetical protein PDESU_03369 [Pontiella desulfatans]|uniref:Rhamnogalacturonase A/B/Epimerase-like pectate lyase domain-containing protein n=1 Tax=Pontiella desulfatans TaxID=2750659 RepID=A0A6C2U498_PONDE|nr:glycoside hydrolase family 55 protein [Pontiella desulfatans]VGO14800.1 hypothetical protein PDESU_03369 [Pontiella desulfatans]
MTPTRNLLNKCNVRWFAVVVAVVSFGSTSQATSFPDMPTHGPTDQFPPSFFDFIPPVGGVAADASPLVNEWTRHNQPGDTMALTGEDLSFPPAGKPEGADTTFLFFGQNFAVTSGIVQRVEGRHCAVTLPFRLPPDEMYLAWPTNSNGVGMPVAINQTESWWIGFDEVAAGETFSVYGRNLSLGGGACWVYIEETGDWEKSFSANPYKADFTCPDLKNGTYTIWPHNGHGDKYGWGAPRKLTVRDANVWSDDSHSWFNVKDYGAVGDGITDDTEAINLAAKEAGDKPYSTVYFPAGTFLVSDRIYPNRAFLRYKGAGESLTTLQAASDSFGSSKYMLPLREDSAVEDLAFNKGDLNVIPITVQGGRTRSHITLTRVTSSALSTGPLGDTSGAPALDYTSGKYFKAKDCTFITNYGVKGGKADQVLFENCEFVGIGDCNGLMWYEGSRFAMTGCHAHPYDASSSVDGLGWAKGRWVYGGGYITKAYIGDNVSIDMAPRLADPFYRGNPVSISALEWVDPEKTGPTDQARQVLSFSDLGRQEIGNVQASVGEVGHKRPEWGSKIESWDYDQGQVEIRGMAKNLASSTDDEVIFFDIVDQNAGEQFLWEAMVVTYAGSPSAVTDSATLHFGDLEEDFSGYTMIIAEGRGAGQSSKLAASDTSNGTVTLETPLGVEPDSTSLCKIGKFLDRVVLYGNDLSGTDRASEAGVYTATTGISCYGGGSKLIVDGNKFSKMKSGVVLWAGAGEAPSNIMQPNVFNVVKNNTIESCQNGVANVVNDWGHGVQQDKTFFCNVTRSNRIVNSTVAAFVNSTSEGRQRKDLCVFEQIHLESNAAMVLEENVDVHNQIWIRNEFTVEGSGHINITIVLPGGVDESRRNTSSYPLVGFGDRPVRAMLYDIEGTLIQTWNGLEDESRLYLENLMSDRWYEVKFFVFQESSWTHHSSISIGPNTQ